MNVLIIGLGSIARKHIDALHTIEKNVYIYALRHGNSCNNIEGVINLYSKEDVFVLKVNFVIISNPTSEHLETIEWALKIGCPIFIEKPIFNELKNLPFIDVLTYVACNLRFLDCIQWVKKNVERKCINEINCYCGSYLPEWRQGVDWRKIYSANKEMGGGIHLDLIHEIDYLYWLFGKPTEVKKVLRSNSSLNISAVDYANYSLVFDTFTASVILNYYRRDYKRTFELVFDDSTWLVNLANNRIVDNRGNVLYSSHQQVIDTYILQMKYFVKLVKQNKKESMNSVQDAIEVLKICLEDETSK